MKGMLNRVLLIPLAGWLIAAGSLWAQSPAPQLSPSPKIDAYTPEQLRQMKSALEAKASDSGTASETLAHYPGHYTMLAYRNQSGGAELHENFADVFVIVEGSATLLTGGTIVAPKTTAPGEIRGTAVEHGETQSLHPGEIVHIPAGVPHQMKLDPGKSVLYFVVKAQEKPTP